MVGWNVAVTQLVAERVLYKISNIVYFTFVIIFTLMNMMNMLNECTFASAVYVNDYASQHVLCSSISIFIYVHVHGAVSPDG